MGLWQGTGGAGGQQSSCRRRHWDLGTPASRIEIPATTIDDGPVVRGSQGSTLKPFLYMIAGVQMREAPPPAHIPEYDLEEEGDPDVRLSQYARDHCVVRFPSSPLRRPVPFPCGSQAQGVQIYPTPLPEQA